MIRIGLTAVQSTPTPSTSSSMLVMTSSITPSSSQITPSGTTATIGERHLTAVRQVGVPGRRPGRRHAEGTGGVGVGCSRVVVMVVTAAAATVSTTSSLTTAVVTSTTATAPTACVPPRLGRVVKVEQRIPRLS